MSWRTCLHHRHPFHRLPTVHPAARQKTKVYSVRRRMRRRRIAGWRPPRTAPPPTSLPHPSLPRYLERWEGRVVKSILLSSSIIASLLDCYFGHLFTHSSKCPVCHNHLSLPVNVKSAAFSCVCVCTLLSVPSNASISSCHFLTLNCIPIGQCDACQTGLVYPNNLEFNPTKDKPGS